MLDPWEKWIVMAHTGPASRIGPWLIIALPVRQAGLLLLVDVLTRSSHPKESTEEETDQ